MLNTTTTKKSFVLAALMACTGLTSAQAQMLSSGSNNVSVPEMVTKTPVSREGDNLGNHTAEQILDMQGHEITGVVTNGSDESSAVNVGWIFDPDNGVRDNLGNHIAEQILNMRGYKVVNVANAYGGANGDAVNIWTLQRYLSEIPGPDNLGNHIATRDLFLNGHTIRLGPITSTDPNTGLPLAPSGLVISQTMVSGLDLPVNGSDAANKAYVDGMVGSIDMSNVVYTVGNQSINGVKTFVQQIQANGGLNSGNQKIVNLADPTAPQDAVNLRTMETALTNIEQNLVLSQPYTVRPVATGSHSFAAGQNAIVGGGNSVALGTNAVATGNGSVALGFRASSSFFNDVVIGNGARNVGDNGRNVIIGEGAVVNRGAYNIVMGVNAQATSPSTGGGSIVAIGENTTAAGQHAVAMGPGANASTTRALAVGSIARASGNESIALGRLSVASAASSVALGYEAQATATNAIALGRLSVANIADTVSVGNDTIKRRILNVGDPSLDTDAVNLRTLRTEISAYSRYSAGDGILFGTPVAGITPINVDTSVVRTVGTQVIGGNKTFTSSVVVDSDANSGFGMRTAAGVIKSTIFSNADSLRFVRYAPDGTTIGAQLAILADGRIMPTNGRFDGAGQTITSVADPVNPTDAVNLRTLQNAVSTGGDNLGNHIATTILNMSNNRIINVSAPINGGDAVNKTYVDNLVAGAAYTAGSGIAINAANVISVDTTVVRTTGNQNIDGNKTFSSSINIAADTNQGIRFRNAANLMQGFIFGNANSVRIYAYQADGSTVGGQLAILADGRIQPATGRFDAANRVISTVADPVAAQDAVNLRTLQSAIGSSAYTAGDGLALTGNVFSVNTTVVRTAGDQTVAGNKTFSSPIRVVNTFNIDGSNPGDQQNGLYVASLEGVVGTTQNPVFTAAIMAQTSVNRSIGVTVDNAGYLYGFRSHSAAGTYTWQSRVRQADTATTLTTPYTGGSGITINSANVVAVDGTVVRTTGNQSIAGLKTFTTAIEIINSAVQPGLRVTRTGVPYNSSMSFTTDAGTLYAGQGEAGTFALSNNQDMRYATNGVFEVAMATGDVRWKGTATGILNAANARVQMVADPTAPQDAVNLRTLQAAVSAGGDNLGNHIATTTLNLSGNRIINVAAPIAGTDAVNKTYVDNLYSAGTGLSLAGNQFSFDQTWGDNRYAEQRMLNTTTETYDDLTGGVSGSSTMTFEHAQAGRPTDSPLVSQASGIRLGNTWGRAYLLFPNSQNRVFYRSGTRTAWSEMVTTENIQNFIDTYGRTYLAGSGLSLTGSTFAVDTTVVRTTGNQSISGVKTFTGSINVNGTSITPDVVISRTNANHNANMMFVTTGTGNVTVGQGDNGNFNIGAGGDIRYAQSGVFSVNASNGNMAWKGTATGILNAANERVQMVADPTAPQDAVNLRTLQAAITAGGDNLGNHIATTTLNLSNNRIINVAAPINGGDAVNKTYVDNLISGAAYTAGTGITIASNVVAVDSTVVRTTGDQTIGGSKTFTSPIIGELSVVDTRTITGSTGNAYVPAPDDLTDRSFSTLFSQGFSGSGWRSAMIMKGWTDAHSSWAISGPAQANDERWFLRSGVGTTWSADREIIHSGNIGSFDTNTTYTAGSGLSLTGTVFAVDTTVVRTTGNQNIAGIKTFTTSVDVSNASAAANLRVIRPGSTINSGMAFVTDDGTVNVGQGAPGTFSIANNQDMRYATNGVFEVGTATGNVRWKGVATGEINAANTRVQMVADPTGPQDAVNLRTLQSAIGSTSYTAADGLTLTGNAFSVNTTVVRTTGNQTIGGTKSFTSPIVVTNTFDVNGSAANAQQNGFYIADLGTTVGTTLNPVQTLGIMAQTNAARSIGVTVDSSGYLYGFRSHSAAGTYTWQSRTRFADRLTTARTINGVSFDGSSNITIPDNNTTYSAGSGLSLSGTTFAVDNTVVRTTGNQDIAGLKTFTNGDIVLASNTNNNMYMRTGAGLNRFLLWAHGTNGNSYLRNYDTDGTTIASELVLTGNGLIFPTTGNLDGNNRVITRVANPVNQTDAVNLRSLNSAYTGGSGINVSSQVVSVDSSVVRTSGDQTISGVKTFNGTVNMNGWDTLRLNAGAATLQVGPNQVRTATDTDLGFYAGNRAGNARISMYLTSLGTVTYDSRSYNSPIMYIGIPYQAGITGNVVAGTGQDAGDDGAGTIAAISYRDFRIFRRTSVSGGFVVFGSRANDIARFDVPMVGYNGLTVSPGTGGEIRFHAPIYAHNYQTFSDARLKDNIETIEADDGLNIIRDLRPAFFTYKEDGRKASGVIAQEIQETMPWAVLKAKDGMLTVDYLQIIAPLTAAVQNVDARTSELEAQLAAEIQRNDALEARIEKLEALMSQEP